MPDLFGSEGMERAGQAPAARPVRPAVGRVAAPGETPAAAISVFALTRTAKDLLEGAVPPLWVRGEVSDFKRHRNGHWYFSLRDESALLRCVFWSQNQRRVPTAPADGMQVTAYGQLTVWPVRGDMQLNVMALDAAGDGLWRKALDEARSRLQADGLLEPARRRLIPRHPQRVAVITSPDGAALHDIISVIQRRCALVEIVLVAAKVQGDGAANEIVAALERVGRWRLADTVIVGRGGGAREDLWTFNDERVARAVAACPIPVISAVGHETDVTLCDLVADLRAATPSAAAEAAVPVLADLRTELASLRQQLAVRSERRVRRARERLARAGRDMVAATHRGGERRRAALAMTGGRLHALSPLAILQRGYAVATDAAGRTLANAADFIPGAHFALTLRDGRVAASVNRSDPAPVPPRRTNISSP